MIKHFFLLIIVSIISISAYSQKIFSVQYSNQADVKVYVVKYENQADLKVYKVDYDNQAGDNNGLWFFTKYSNQATTLNLQVSFTAKLYSTSLLAMLKKTYSPYLGICLRCFFLHYTNTDALSSFS